MKNEAITDLRDAIKKRSIFITLGWQDVATRYRRSRVGAFWLTINMLIMIVVLGTIFGSVFKLPLEDFLPKLSVGILMWGFISALISDGCVSYISAQEVILQVSMPLSTHVLGVVWRNIIIFVHNLLIFPLIYIFFQWEIGFESLYSILGFLLMVINVSWISLLLAIICCRYRDMIQIVQNALQVFFYATPIIWQEDMLEGVASSALQYNPFYHLLVIVRDPLFGIEPKVESWLAAVGMSFVGWLFALALFNKYKKRIPYWL